MIWTRLIAQMLKETNNVSTTSNNPEIKRWKICQTDSAKHKSSTQIQLCCLLPPTSRGNYCLQNDHFTQNFRANLIKVLDAAASVVSNLNDLHTQRKDALEIVATLFTQ